MTALHTESRSFHESVFQASERRARVGHMNTSRATDLWLGELERRNHSESTVNSYRRLLDKLSGEYPVMDVDELTASMIRRFLDTQARRRDGKRKAASTIAQNVSIIQGFFDWLTKEGEIDRNPTRRNGDRILERPRQLAPEDNDAVVTVSTEDVKQLVVESRRLGRWDEALAIHCLVYLGPRRKAIAQARIGDYNQTDQTLTLREKGSKTIRKPVPWKLAALIEEALMATDENGVPVYSSQDDYLIPSRADQRRRGDRDDRVIWRIVKQVAERAGVETHVHALRAAFAVHFLTENPGQVVALQKLMGHRRIETTMVYLRRMDRQAQMEQVRDLDWGDSGRGEIRTLEPARASQLLSRQLPSATRAPDPGSKQIADKRLESSEAAEPVDLQPSFSPKPHGSGAGTQGEGAAPGERLH